MKRIEILILVLALLAAAVFTLDLLADADSSVAILYIFVIFVSFRSPAPRHPLLAAFGCSALAIGGVIVDSQLGNENYPLREQLINLGMSLLCVWGVAVFGYQLIGHKRQTQLTQADLQRRIQQSRPSWLRQVSNCNRKRRNERKLNASWGILRPTICRSSKILPSTSFERIARGVSYSRASRFVSDWAGAGDGCGPDRSRFLS